MDDYQNKNNNEEDEYEEIEVEYDESDEEEDEKSEYKKNKNHKKEKRISKINNNKKQKITDNITNTTNEEKKHYNDKDIKETKYNYINENIENNILRKNSFENTSQYRSFREENAHNQINYLNESNSNLNRSIKLKLLGLKNNINKKKNERVEKDIEQLKVLKDIYVNEIMKLRNELDIANYKLIKETKEKSKLLKLLDEASNKLNSYDSYDVKPYVAKNKIRNSPEKNIIEGDLIKLIELKRKEFQELIKENVILKNEIKKLKSEIKQYNNVEKVELLNENRVKDREIKKLKSDIKQYNNVEKVELLNENREKDREINNLKRINEEQKRIIDDLKKLNGEQKRLLDDFKYEQLILHINNEMDKKEGIINDLNNKLNSLSLKIKDKENKMNKVINLKFNNINNYSAQKNKRNEFHSLCRCRLKSDLLNNNSQILRPRSNFYKLFDEKERNAINALFESNEELNDFKAKIANIEKRNYERIKKNKNNELVEMYKQKEEIIRELNKKEKEILKRINDCKIQLRTNPKINEELEKIIKKKDELENIYRELLKRKEEEIQKLIQDKIKAKEILQKNSKDIRGINMIKREDEDLQSFKDELGEINEIDIDKNIKPKNNMSSSSLLIQKNDDIIYKGLSNMDRLLENKEENEEKKKENNIREDEENN